MLFVTGLLWGSGAAPGTKWILTGISVLWLFTVPSTILGGSIGLILVAIGVIVGKTGGKRGQSPL